MITVSPLLLGSNRPLFWALNAILGAFIILSLIFLERHAVLRSRFSWTLPLLAMATLGGIALWSATQAAPFVPEPAKHPIWSLVAKMGLVPQGASISVGPSSVWGSIAFVSTLAATLLATIRIGNSAPRSNFALAYLVGVSTAVALFGIAVVRFDLGTVGLIEKNFYRDWVTGTFVNRNAAAIYFATAMLVALALGSCFLIGVGRGRKFGLASFAFLAAAFLFAALLMTGSRGGLAAGLMGSLIVLGLAHRVQRQAALSSLWSSLTQGLLTVAAIVLIGYALLGRVGDASESNLVRIGLMREALEAISDRPWLGHGSGSYGGVQSMYHSLSTPSDFVWAHAHSTYLESAATLGIPVAVVALIILLYIALRILRVTWNARLVSPAPIAFVASTIAILLQSAVDFSIQTEAITIQYTSLLGLALGQTMLAGETDSASSRDQNGPDQG